MKVKSLPILAIIALSSTTVSCTIKNDDEPKPGKARLESITVMSIPFFAMTYDNSGRVIQFSDMMSYSKTTIDYSKRVMEILEYDITYKGDVYLSSSLIWNGFEQNSNGYIISANATETDYDYGGNVTQEYKYPVKFEYNSNGNLTQFTIVDDVDGDEITNYEWRDGLLHKVTWEGAYINYSYDSAPDNYNRQWVPWWGDPSIYAISGLFGVAPVKLITNAFIKHENGETESMSFFYSMTESGYISGMIMGEEYDDSAPVSYFNYKNTRGIGEVNFEKMHKNKRKSEFEFFHKKNK